MEPLGAGALQPAEHGCAGAGLDRGTQTAQLRRKRGLKRLAARLSALAAAHEQRGAVAVELEVAPVKRDQLRAAKAGGHERQQHKAIALGQPGPPPRRRRCGIQQARELLLGQPVGDLARLVRASSSTNGSGTPARRDSQRKNRRRRVKRR